MLRTLAQSDRDALPLLHRRQEQVIEQACNTDVPAYDGAGIVIVAGGGQAFANAWVTLTNLRDVLNCRLPIQIWHLGPGELSCTMRSAISRRFEVELVDAFEVRRHHPIRRLTAWECKAYAVLHSPYRHVILLDADNIPLADPATLLDAPDYHRTGAIFWPDNQRHLPDSPVWELFDVPYRDEMEVESGQLVIDKARCWLPLNLAVHYNSLSDVYYRYVYGDKETFHFAWRRVEQAYTMPEGRPKLVYCHWDTPHGRRRMTAALEQRSPSTDGIMFHHRTGAKWKLFGENPTTGHDELDQACLGALAELRTYWDGRVSTGPVAIAHDGVPDARGNGTYLYRRLGVSERIIELAAGGRIIHGAADDLETWREHGSLLTITGKQADICHLKLQPDGVWRGRECWYARVAVELVPLARKPCSD